MDPSNAILKKKIEQKQMFARQLVAEALPLWKDLIRTKQDIKQHEMDQEESKFREKQQQREILKLQKWILDVSLFDPVNQTQSIEFITSELVSDKELMLTGVLTEAYDKLREVQVNNTTKAIIKATEDAKKEEETVRAKVVELREAINQRRNLKAETKQMQITKIEGLALLLKAKQKQKEVLNDAIDSHDKLVEMLHSNKKQIQESISKVESSRSKVDPLVEGPPTLADEVPDCNSYKNDSVPQTEKSSDESTEDVEIDATDSNDVKMQGEVCDENQKPKKQRKRKNINKVRESDKMVNAIEPGQYFSQSEEQPRKYSKRTITKSQ